MDDQLSVFAWTCVLTVGLVLMGLDQLSVEPVSFSRSLPLAPLTSLQP